VRDRGTSNRLLAGVFCLCLGAACAADTGNVRGPGVIPVPGVPGPRCESQGTVIGQSRSGAFGATADQLIQEATTQALNEAAARGATHIMLSPVKLETRDGAPSQATLTGATFRCPPPGQ